jgi:hypothetical protein
MTLELDPALDMPWLPAVPVMEDPVPEEPIFLGRVYAAMGGQVRIDDRRRNTWYQLWLAKDTREPGGPAYHVLIERDSKLSTVPNRYNSLFDLQAHHWGYPYVITPTPEHWLQDAMPLQVVVALLAAMRQHSPNMYARFTETPEQVERYFPVLR